MKCERCHGLCVKEPVVRSGIYDPGSSGWWWKCFNCGDRIDAQILLNRSEQSAARAFQLESQDRTLKDWAFAFP